VLTVATDGVDLYRSETDKAFQHYYGGSFDQLDAAEAWGAHLHGCRTDHVEELGQRGRERIFNLGYYTWVEQQGKTVEQFNARRSQAFWKDQRQMAGEWDQQVTRFNEATGAVSQEAQCAASM